MPRNLSVHAGNRKTTKSDLGAIDLPYFFLTLLLVTVGLIVLLSASYARAYHVTGNSASYFTSQLVFALMGVAAMLFVSRVPYDRYRKFYRVILAVTVLLLAATLASALLAGRLSVRTSTARLAGSTSGLRSFSPRKSQNFP